MKEIYPFRNILLQDYRSISDLPAIFRWLYDVHAQDSISRFEPYTTKYCTYHALPLPERGEEFGLCGIPYSLISRSGCFFVQQQ